VTDGIEGLAQWPRDDAARILNWPYHLSNEYGLEPVEPPHSMTATSPPDRFVEAIDRTT